jgi:hypothetical protein
VSPVSRRCWGFPIMVPTMDIFGCSLIIQWKMWINTGEYNIYIYN